MPKHDPNRHADQLYRLRVLKTQIGTLTGQLVYAKRPQNTPGLARRLLAWVPGVGAGDEILMLAQGKDGFSVLLHGSSLYHSVSHPEPGGHTVQTWQPIQDLEDEALLSRDPTEREEALEQLNLVMTTLRKELMRHQSL